MPNLVICRRHQAGSRQRREILDLICDGYSLVPRTADGHSLVPRTADGHSRDI